MDEVAAALRKLDIQREPLRKDTRKTFLEDRVATESVPSDTVSDTDSDDSIDSHSANAIFAEIEEMDLDEDKGREVLAALVNVRKKTWSENKKIKRGVKKDRRFFDSSSASSARPKGQKGTPRNRLSVDQLKLVTRCGNCGEKGHWHKECKNPPRPKQPSAFVFAFADHEITQSAQKLIGVLKNLQQSGAGDPSVFFAIDPGTGLVDTAAAQAIMGLPALEKAEQKLKARGLRVIWRKNRRLRKSSGIGGSVQPMGTVLMPTQFGSHRGVIEFVTLKQDVPCILPMGLLESLGALIDTQHNELTKNSWVVRVRGLGDVRGSIEGCQAFVLLSFCVCFCLDHIHINRILDPLFPFVPLSPSIDMNARPC